MLYATVGYKAPVPVSYRAECVEVALRKTDMRNRMPLPPPGDELKTNADATWQTKSWSMH